jgi:hypothetical protein
VRVPGQWGIDLQSEHERYLTEKHAKTPVIVMNYPKDIKAFYMRVNDDSRTVVAMDVLASGIGEIIGGSQREEPLDVLDRSMAERGIDREHYAWYRDLRRYGAVPHAGFDLAPASTSPRLSPGAPSPTSPASPTCATPFPSRNARERAVLSPQPLAARCPSTRRRLLVLPQISSMQTRRTASMRL